MTNTLEPHVPDWVDRLLAEKGIAAGDVIDIEFSSEFSGIDARGSRGATCRVLVDRDRPELGTVLVNVAERTSGVR